MQNLESVSYWDCQ